MRAALGSHASQGLTRQLHGSHSHCEQGLLFGGDAEKVSSPSGRRFCLLYLEVISVSVIYFTRV